MHDVGYLESIAPNVADSLELFGKGIGVFTETVFGVSEEAVADALADIEGLPIPWVN